MHIRVQILYFAFHGLEEHFHDALHLSQRLLVCLLNLLVDAFDVRHENVLGQRIFIKQFVNKLVVLLREIGCISKRYFNICVHSVLHLRHVERCQPEIFQVVIDHFALDGELLKSLRHSKPNAGKEDLLDEGEFNIPQTVRWDPIFSIVSVFETGFGISFDTFSNQRTNYGRVDFLF